MSVSARRIPYRGQKRWHAVFGLIFGLGNRMSAGLPPRLILISGALAAQTFVNLPLTIGMVTYGGALLFLLWYVTPRTIFEPRT